MLLTALLTAQAFEAASGLKVNMNITNRRPGDAEAVWAATEFAEKELGSVARSSCQQAVMNRALHLIAALRHTVV